MFEHAAPQPLELRLELGGLECELREEHLGGLEPREPPVSRQVGAAEPAGRLGLDGQTR